MSLSCIQRVSQQTYPRLGAKGSCPSTKRRADSSHKNFLSTDGMPQAYLAARESQDKVPAPEELTALGRKGELTHRKKMQGKPLPGAPKQSRERAVNAQMKIPASLEGRQK